MADEVKNEEETTVGTEETNGSSSSPQKSQGPPLSAETEEFLRQVEAEVKALEGSGSYHLVRAMAEREIARIKAGEITEQGFVIVHRDTPVKIVRKVFIPIKDHPKVNFVGRLLGPKGNTLKALQHNTRARILIFGKGSTWDKAKEEEMRASGDPKYAHLNEELHVFVEIHAPPVEAQGRFTHVLAELRKFLDPNQPGYIPNEEGGMRGGMRGPPPMRGGHHPHMRGGPRGGRGYGGGAPRGGAPTPDGGYYGGNAPAAGSTSGYPTSEYSNSQGYTSYPPQQDYSSGGYQSSESSAYNQSYASGAGYAQSNSSAYPGYETGWGDAGATNGQAGGKAPPSRFQAPKMPRPSPYAQPGGYQ